MKPDFGFTEGHFNTRFAPLCVVGHMIREQQILDPLLSFDLIAMKTRDHTPGEKLMDAFLLILAGYPSLYLLNEHLRPDPGLAQAWGQDDLAEQSVISRLLDRFDEAALSGLRTISWKFWAHHSRLFTHDWRRQLVVDLDLTPLLASSRAEASTKGYLGKKTSQAVNWHGLCCIRIENRCSPSSIQATNIAPTVYNRR